MHTHRDALWGVWALAAAAAALGAPCGVGFDAHEVATGVGLTDAEIADLDADGAMDLIVCDGIGGVVTVYFGDGVGGFGDGVSRTAPGAPAEARAGDLDQDGALDLVVVSVTRNESFVTVYLGDGSRGLTAGASTLCAAGALALDLADLSADGAPDVVLANTERSGASVLMNQKDGTLGPEQIVTTTPADLGVPYVRAVAGDLDADGFIDLAHNSHAGGGVYIAFGSGGGAFEAPVFVPCGANPSWLDATDVNADGRPDLLTTSQGDDAASVLLNLGARAFAPAQHYPVAFNPRAVASADIDNDAIPDLLCSGSDPGALAVFRGVGDGAFVPARSENVGGFRADLEIADLDGDALNDLVMVDIESETVDVYLNACPCPADLDANGVVGSRDLASLLAAWGTGLVDLDGDGATTSRDLAALLAVWGPCP